MKVTELIKKEHKELTDLFEAFEKKPSKKIIEQVNELIHPHHFAEEEVVFPKVEQTSKPKEEVVKSLMAEHDLIVMQLNEILGMKVSDDLFEAKVSVLHEVVEHHLKEEEEVFFKHAEEVYTEAQLEKASVAFKKAKAEYKPTDK